MLASQGGSAAGKRLGRKPPPADIAKDKHLHFDEADVIVRGGAGGHGKVLSLPAKGEGPRLKRNADDDFELPPGGGDGGDVILFVDPAVCDLLHLRGRPTLAAARGGDSLGLPDLPAARQRRQEVLADRADAADALGGSSVSLSSVRLRDGQHLRVPVPPGTFVRTKSGRVLGDLVRPGAELRVACGGDGGPCVLRQVLPSSHELPMISP